MIRAQHPGSAKIEEFLGQLEVLWEELRRRHQRNAVFLQASEELGFRVRSSSSSLTFVMLPRIGIVSHKS